LAADPRGLLPGLVVGDTSNQPGDLGEAMRATGLTHLAAVSGTNVSLVAAFALAVARGVGLGRRVRVLVAAAVLAGFVVLARPEPSVLRAAVMGGLGLLAWGTARSRAALPALGAAVVGLLVVDPWLARSYGFALSVLATAGILLLAAPWSERLARWGPRPLATALAVPLAAQVFCTPVLVLLAPQVSLVAVPANVLAEPWVAPATVLGLGAALVSVPAPWLATGLAWLAGIACSVICWVARGLARVPGGQLPWPTGVLGLMMAVAVAGSVVLAFQVGPRRRAGLLALGGVPVLVLALAGRPDGSGWRPPGLPGGPSWPPKGWVMVACDVGQGDALVLSSGPGHAVLVDVGPDPAAVDSCLRRLGVRVLDLVVLTHFHADHVDGLAGALHGRRAGGLLVTIVDDPPGRAAQVRKLAARAGVPVRVVVDGESASVGAVRWRVLWPARVIHDGSVPNNASIVLLVRSAGLRLLLLGDIEPAAASVVARRLADSPGGPRVDVLKVAHHGSNQQDVGLLAEAAAPLAVISVGAGNDYGHPGQHLLAELSRLGAVVARTDRQGDVAVVATSGRLWMAASGPRPLENARR
jgi:competence protein ComEC